MKELHTQINTLFAEVGDLRQVSAKAQVKSLQVGVEQRSLDAVVGDHCKQFQEQVDEPRACIAKELEGLRAEIYHFRHIESNRVSELCSSALAGWEAVHTETVGNLEQKLESFREAF